MNPKMTIQQTSIDQTGIAIFETINGEEKQIPLYSLAPCEEAQKELAPYIEGELKHVFITNNLCEYRIEDEIRDYKETYNGSILEEYMDQLASGFPFIEGYGYESDFRMLCYT